MPIPLLKIDGEVQRPATLSFEDLAALADDAQVPDVSRIDAKRKGGAVRLAGLLALVEPKTSARYLTLHASRDDFHASIPLESVREQAILIYQLGDGPLPESAGGPLRF